MPLLSGKQSAFPPELGGEPRAVERQFVGLVEACIRKFYDSYVRLGRFLVGELAAEWLTLADQRMLADVWAPLDLHETLHGVKGKLALAGNTWRARWKYREFTDISWLKALWIQVKGFLFMRNPVLHETLMENALI